MNDVKYVTQLDQIRIDARAVASQIVREEWHRAVKEFGLLPGSPTEAVVARILERLAETR